MKITQLSKLIHNVTGRLNRHEHVSDESDRSHEEASFDAEMRSYFRVEYGTVVPPDNISVQLIQAIRLTHEKQSKGASAGSTGALIQIFGKLAQVPGAIYRAGSRPAGGRLLSGSVLGALLVMAMAPKMMQSFNGRGGDLLYGSQKPNTVEVWSDTFKEKIASVRPMDGRSDINQGSTISRGLDEQVRLKLELMTGEDFDAPVYVIIENAELHPVERGMAPKRTSVPQDARNRPRTIQW